MNSQATWRILVKTANTVTSGISSPVYIKIHGDQGSVKPIELNDAGHKAGSAARNPFSRNVISQFLAKRDNVGFLNSIEVWHNDPTGDWACEWIEVQRDNESWKFIPDGVIPSQRDGEVVKATRLLGEYTKVTNGATPFHNAAKDGNMKTLTGYLANKEYDVDLVDKLGRTPAMYAAEYGQRDALALLIEYKARVDRTDRSGRTCLHHAALNHVNTLRIVEILLKNCPTDGGGGGGGGGGDDGGGRGRGDEDDDEEMTMETYIRLGDNYGKNAMHYAATYGFPPLIQLLDSKCRPAIRDTDNVRQTPLHCAAIQGETEAALTLIDLGAEIDARNREEKSFLHHAATAGHVTFLAKVLTCDLSADIKDRLQALLKSADISGRTPMMCAAATGQSRAVRDLFNFGSDVFHVDKDRSTMLHHAAKRGDESLLSYLAEKLEVNSRNDYEFTPLHVTVEHNNVPGARWLLQNGADIFAKTMSGETPLELAMTIGDEEMIRILQNEQNVRQEEAKLRGEGGEGAQADGAGGTGFDITHPDDARPFYDGTTGGGEGSDGIPKDVLMELEWLRKEVRRLTNENDMLKEKLRKSKRLVDLLKDKAGLSQADLDAMAKEDGRMCQDPQCVVM